jgi:hypothetical protein
MGWDTFWGIFSQISSGHPDWDAALRFPVIWRRSLEKSTLTEGQGDRIIFWEKIAQNVAQYIICRNTLL